MIPKSIKWPTSCDLRTFEVVDSTNRLASKIYREEKNSKATWIQAYKQTSGYGRRSRQWLSSADNLQATLILPTLHYNTVPPLSFITALAVYDVVSCILSDAASQFKINVKWPNDVLVNRRKVCGILLEAISQKTQIEAVLIGVGLNINSAPPLEDLLSPSSCPICLAEIIKNRIDVSDIMVLLASYFASWLKIWDENGTQHVMSTWRKRAFGLGEYGLARLDNKIVEGYFRTVTDAGILVVDTSHGQEEVHAGDVFVFSKCE